MANNLSKECLKVVEEVWPADTSSFKNRVGDDNGYFQSKPSTAAVGIDGGALSWGIPPPIMDNDKTHDVSKLVWIESDFTIRVR